MISPEINDVCSIFKQVLVHQMVSCDIKWRFFHRFYNTSIFLAILRGWPLNTGLTYVSFFHFPFLYLLFSFRLVHLLVCFFAFLLNFPQVIHLVIQTFNRLAVY